MSVVHAVACVCMGQCRCPCRRAGLLLCAAGMRLADDLVCPEASDEEGNSSSGKEQEVIDEGE